MYGVFDMLSVPPASTTRASPRRMCACRHEHRLQPRGAGLVDGEGGPVDRDAGAEGDLARGVGPAAGLPAVAEDRVVDPVRRQPRPLEAGRGGGGSEVGRRQRARAPPNLPIGVRTGAARTIELRFTFGRPGYAPENWGLRFSL